MSTRNLPIGAEGFNYYFYLFKEDDTMSRLSSNSRVSETGAVSYQQSVEANRRLREIKFKPQHCYIRGFLKYATTADTRPGKDAIFITNEKPSHVFIGEVLGEPVYNPNDEAETVNGYRVNPKHTCLEAMVEIAEKIYKVCETVPVGSDEEAYEKAFEDNEFKLSWAKSYVSAIKESIVVTRPEYASQFGFKEFYNLRTNFDVIIKPILKDMIKTFSVLRTDLITWVAKSQTVNIKERFSIGSIVAAEEDDGKQLDMCYKLAALSEEISMHNFLKTPDGQVFPVADMKSSSFRDAYRKWAYVFKTGRIPWSRPTDNPVHFCISVECTLDKTKLVVDETTRQPAYSFGFYRSSLGDGGKMNKILGAAKTGTANDDPDYIMVFMSYTSSDDPQTASKNMTVSDIDMSGKKVFSPEQITDAFNTVAQDTYKRKVRLYDEFPLYDRIADFRAYVLEENVLSWIDTSKFAEAFEILGITVEKTDAESLAADLYNKAPAQAESPMAAAAQMATATATPTSDPSVGPQISASGAQIDPAVPIRPTIPGMI